MPLTDEEAQQHPQSPILDETNKVTEIIQKKRILHRFSQILGRFILGTLVVSLKS